MIDLNVRALVELTYLYWDRMLANKRGGVINVASTAAFQPGPLMANYYASKAYVLSFSEAMWEEARGTGVHVSCLCPARRFRNSANARAPAKRSSPRMQAPRWRPPRRPRRLQCVETKSRRHRHGRPQRVPGRAGKIHPAQDPSEDGPQHAISCNVVRAAVFAIAFLAACASAPAPQTGERAPPLPPQIIDAAFAPARENDGGTRAQALAFVGREDLAGPDYRPVCAGLSVDPITESFASRSGIVW